MVQVPRKTNKFCENCKSHQEHTTTQYKTGKARITAQGKRRYDEKQQGYGGQTRPIFHKKAKTTRKVQLNLKCTVCSETHKQDIKRTKHFEIVSTK